MTRESWIEGSAELMAAFPERDLPQAVQDKRGEIYERELKHLGDHVWREAVRLAVQNERWFPTVNQLLDYAASVSPSTAWADDRSLPPYRPSAEEREEQRRIAAEGIELCRQAFLAATRDSQSTSPAQPERQPGEEG